MCWCRPERAALCAASAVPALRQAGLVVEVQTGWVDDLVDLFNRSTVYLTTQRSTGAAAA